MMRRIIHLFSVVLFLSMLLAPVTQAQEITINSSPETGEVSTNDSNEQGRTVSNDGGVGDTGTDSATDGTGDTGTDTATDGTGDTGTDSATDGTGDTGNDSATDGSTDGQTTGPDTSQNDPPPVTTGTLIVYVNFQGGSGASASDVFGIRVGGIDASFAGVGSASPLSFTLDTGEYPITVTSVPANWGYEITDASPWIDGGSQAEVTITTWYTAPVVEQPQVPVTTDGTDDSAADTGSDAVVDDGTDDSTADTGTDDSAVDTGTDDSTADDGSDDSAVDTGTDAAIDDGSDDSSVDTGTDATVDDGSDDDSADDASDTGTDDGTDDGDPAPEVTAVMPGTPGIDAESCIEGRHPIVLPGSPDGIDYAITGNVVTATAPQGTVLGDLTGTNWEVLSTTQATYTFADEDLACESTPDATLVVPAAPGIDGASCTDGYHPVILPETDGISYAMSGNPAAGENVVVTATLAAEFAWGVIEDARWSVSGNQATFAIAPNELQCEAAPEVSKFMPAIPTVDPNGECVDGLRSITVPASTVDIAYALQGETSVTATLLVSGAAFSDLSGTGWTTGGRDSQVATFTFAPADLACEAEKFSILQNETTAGYGITKTFSPRDVVAGTVVTFEIIVTFPAGAPGSGFTVTDNVPPQITVNGASCASVTAASCSASASGNSVAWSVSRDTGGNGTAVLHVVATVPDNPEFGTFTNEAFVNPDGVPPGTPIVAAASFTILSAPPDSPHVALGIPVVNQGVCVGGTVTAPSVTFPVNDPDVSGVLAYGVVYNPDPPKADGLSTATVSATLNPGFVWDDDISPWTRKAGSSVAYLTLTFDKVECKGTVPIVPQVTDGSCVAGVYKLPTVKLFGNTSTDGIKYVVTGPDPQTGAYSVTATLEDGFAWGSNIPAGWTGSGATLIYSGTLDLGECEPVDLVVPNVTDGSCIDGGYTAPTVTGVATGGVTYGKAVIDPVTGAYTITATIGNGYSWGTLASGWVKNSSRKATFSGTVNLDKCLTLPVIPRVTAGSCVNGVWTQPRVQLFGNTNHDGIIYRVTPPDAVTGVFSVTATLQFGYTWGSPLPTGWSGTGNSLTFTGIAELNECKFASPVTPEVTASVCTGGVVTLPSYTKPTTTGLTYTYTDENLVAGGSVVVTATLTGDYNFGDTTGWTLSLDGKQASKTITFPLVECRVGAPATPLVTLAECIGGVLTQPTLSITSNDDIVYTYDPAGVVNGGEVLITATLQGDYAWADYLNGWTRISNTEATLLVEFDLVSCAPVTPLDPLVVQAVCASNVLTNATVTPQVTEGITYSVSPVAPGAHVVVTATLADGYEWGTLTGDWQEINSTTATLEFDLDAVECEQVVPLAPIVTNADCTNGGLTIPTIAVQSADGITYTLSKSDVAEDNMVAADLIIAQFAPGDTVTITAVIGDGKSWGTMPPGWTVIDEKTATYTIQLDAVACLPIVPVTPAIVDPYCTTAGEITRPQLTMAETAGLNYTLEGELLARHTVTVTAILGDGYAWGTMPAGWNVVDPTMASFTYTFPETTCVVPKPPTEPETPAKPVKPTEPATPPAKGQAPATLPDTGSGQQVSDGMDMSLAYAFMAMAVILTIAGGITRKRRLQ
jgi:hypothetical protein